MRFAIIADAFPPMRTSGAVQLRDLVREFVRQGHHLTVLIPSAEQETPYLVEHRDNVTVIRLKAPRTKDVSYFRRALAEFCLPFSMLARFRKSPFGDERFDGVIWYSPSIFFGPIAKALKRQNRCRGYLILRDIFPEWAADIGLIRRGLAYHIFKRVAAYQYAAADIIGVQTPGNLDYFARWAGRPGRSLEVLHNWLSQSPMVRCTIDLTSSSLNGRKIFVYAGNMGVAQGMEILLDLAERLRARHDIGFLFIGRGSNAQFLRDDAAERRLDNVVFFDEVDPDEIGSLFAQCHVGLVSLDVRHRTHNIPGKFLSYMQAGLPALATVNEGNDLVGLIERERVGRFTTQASAEELAIQAIALLAEIDEDREMSGRCRKLASSMFSTKTAVHQIIAALQR